MIHDEAIFCAKDASSRGDRVDIVSANRIPCAKRESLTAFIFRFSFLFLSLSLPLSLSRFDGNCEFVRAHREHARRDRRITYSCTHSRFQSKWNAAAFLDPTPVSRGSFGSDIFETSIVSSRREEQR